MQFPLITHINDVLPHIEGKDEFRVMDKGDYTVIDYMYQDRDTFESDNPLTKQIRRECHGLIFNKDGHLIRRAFHKFFNLGEKPEHTQENLSLDDYTIHNKFDGSMVTPLYIDGKFHMATRAGITDQGKKATEFVKKHRPDIELFCEECIQKFNLNPIFEYLDPLNPIVLSHSHEDLVLLKVRHIWTGRYLDLYPTGVTRADKLDLGVNLKELVNLASKQEDLEGWVLYRNHVPTVKVKLDWYVQIHRAKDKINSPEAIIELAMINKLDDVKPFLTGSMKQLVDDVESNFWNWYNTKKSILSGQYKHIKSFTTTRKDYALAVQPYDKYTKQILFRLLDGDDLTETLNKTITSNLHPKSKFINITESFLCL